MIDVPRNAIASLLRELRGGGSFATRRTAAANDLAIEVTDVGAVRLPVTAAQAKALRFVARPAKYGHGEETLLDRRVRDTWEVPRSRVRIDQRRWNRTLLPMLDAIRADLGLPDGSRLRAELHSMLVYEPGQFFASHQDSEKHDTMIATLVVLLPSRSTGGDLVIEHRSESVSYSGSATSLVFVAFYADTRHEALPVQSGYRVALTYNLLLTGDGSAAQPPAGPIDEVAAHLGRHFTHTPPPRWRGDRSAVEPPDRLVVLLDHQYSERGLRWSQLKGDDADRAEVLRRAVELAGCDVALAQAEVHETRECYDDAPPRRRRRGWDHDDEPEGDLEVGDLLDVTVTITPAAGNLARVTSVVDEFEIAEVTPTADLTPYDSEYTGFMGNWGNTIDRWYRRAAIVIWPRSRAFAIRAKSDPAGALDELVAEWTTGGPAQEALREQVNALLRFWPTAVRTGDQPQLMPRALRLAVLTTDPHLAEQLLEPFGIEALTPADAAELIALGGQHGLEWLQQRLSTWTDQRHAWTPPVPRTTWTATLPDLCTRLRDTPARDIGTEAAQALTTHLASWLVAAIGDAARLVTPSRREAALDTLAAPTLAVLRAAGIADLPIVREQIRTTLREPGHTLDTLLVDVIEAAAPLPADERTTIGIDTIATHARDTLVASLAAPPRATEDWSITGLATSTCCEDCATLAAFLADPLERKLTWPLAKPRRQHIHHRLDEAELPVTHTTTRQGSPHKLVLTKTPELHRRDAEHRRATERSLTIVEHYLRQPT